MDGVGGRKCEGRLLIIGSITLRRSRGLRVLWLVTSDLSLQDTGRDPNMAADERQVLEPIVGLGCCHQHSSMELPTVTIRPCWNSLSPTAAFCSKCSY